MNSDEYERLRAEILTVSAQATATMMLLGGLAAALKKRNFPDDLIRDAFALAEEAGIFAISNSGQDVAKFNTQAMNILERLRQTMLPDDRIHRP